MITISRTVALKQFSQLAHRTSLIHSFVPELDPLSYLLHLLTVSSETQSLKLTHQSHARAHRLGLTQHPLIAQKLIFSYCKCNEITNSRLVFDSLSAKNSHICNTLLNGYGKSSLFNESLELFRKMSIWFCVDDYTFSIIFKTFGEWGEHFVAKMVHGRGLKSGFVLDTVVGNSLMSMYGKCGLVDDSLKVFEELPLRNVSSWNTMIGSYVKVNMEKGINTYYKIWEFVRGMESEGLKCDAFTISTLFSLCRGEVGESDDQCNVLHNYGRELHCYIVKNELATSLNFDNDVHLGCCLVDMYSKNGKINIGKMVFEMMKYKSVYAWTAMINGYVHCGDFDEALSHFREMQRGDRVEPNKVSLVTVLPACNSVGGLIAGKQIHGFAVRRKLNNEISLCNALLDTYSKCGSLQYATRVFEHECIKKDVISWSSMIFGYGLHSEGQNAVGLFDKMLKNGMKPDLTVVVVVLSACSRSGLLTDGIRIYDLVVNDYGITPSMEIYACMVDLFGRSGKLDRAMEFIQKMPVKPSPSIWGSLISTSTLHGNPEMTDLAYKSLIQIEPANPSNYISLSNMYAAEKRWDSVADLRMKMREKGLRKMPGCSWISINSATHSFYVADKSHPCSDMIYTMAGDLASAMKLSRSNSDFVYLMEVLD